MNLNEVSAFSKGKIPELLSGGSVNSMTRLVLVNALYFKGMWDQPFSKEDTMEVPFKINKVRCRIKIHATVTKTLHDNV